jgi:GTPase
VPPIVALIVAVVGSIVLYNMDFAHHVVVADDGIQKISREALTRAQATATPTLPPGDY